MSKNILSENLFNERFEKLNEKQREAVEQIYGPVLVIAGPGSGKTELLAIRTANILKTTDTSPSNILLLTFTDAASFNMRERLINLIGEEAYRIAIYTFHSFASDIIGKYPEYFFEGAKFKPATEIDQINIIENILKNLPRKNPLSSFHPELGHVYLRDIISAIRDLKKGGLDPEIFQNKLAINKKCFKDFKNTFDALEENVGKSKYEIVTPIYLEILNKLGKLKDKNEIAKVLYNTLELTLEKTENEKTTKYLTNWKNSNFLKTESGKYILYDSNIGNQEKLENLLFVYTNYQQELYKKGIYDFEDMIMLVVKALKENENLKADIQEKFQFIMIDEFQDTNESQFNLILEISKNSYEVNPNVLAVGDDDQAIYKFQGAKLNNIYLFNESFPGQKIIILDKNYRSTQEILDYSKNVILKAVDRLETRDKNIVKNLKSSNDKYLNLEKNKIFNKSFDNELEEYDFIAYEINRIIASGVDPKEIAIICRKHEQLKDFSNILNNFKIPYSYSKKENVLDQEHIKELVTMVKFLHLNNESSGDELLPEILSYKFWNIERVEIWKIAEIVKRGIEIDDENVDDKKNWRKISWLSAMHSSGNNEIRDIANFLIDLSIKSKSTPIEFILDELIGTTEFLWEDSEHDDILTPRISAAKSFISPYKNYYFNNENFNHNKTKYLNFLFSLRTFIGALREFHSDRVLLVKDIFQFLEIYNGNHLTLSLISPFASSENAISLLTAHGAKGLEFEYVFLLSANNEVWKRSNNRSKISFPINLPLTPEDENDDDKIRLLYVALTRAKHTLYITHSSQKLEYLLQDGEVIEKKSKGNISNEIVKSLSIIPNNPYLENEKILLERLLENYKMPVTHLNNFLNFTRVGPEKFIEQNILKFPQAMTASSAYGSAMHAAIERYYLYYKKNNNRANFDYIFSVFQNSLERSRLPNEEYLKYLNSGKENLNVYINYINEIPIIETTKLETKFGGENVILGDCPITGAIDKMEFVGNEIIVTDFKTGDSYNSFEETGLQDYEKIKLHFYKYQIVFYAHLIENSRSFNNYKVKVGNLEFLEHDKNGEINILPFKITDELKERVKNLVNNVYKKIQNLDFPDTSKYPKNLKGIIEFEEDLLNSKI